MQLLDETHLIQLVHFIQHMSLSGNLACWLLASLPCDAVVHNADIGQEDQEAVQHAVIYKSFYFMSTSVENARKCKRCKKMSKIHWKKLLFTLHLQSVGWSWSSMI